jgi:hypothetical protein
MAIILGSGGLAADLDHDAMFAKVDHAASRRESAHVVAA